MKLIYVGEYQKVKLMMEKGTIKVEKGVPFEIDDNDATMLLPTGKYEKYEPKQAPKTKLETESKGDLKGKGKNIKKRGK